MGGTWVAPAQTGKTEFVKIGDAPIELMNKLSLNACAPVFTVPNNGEGIMLQAFDLCTSLQIRMVQTDVQDMPSGLQGCCSCAITKVMDIMPTGVRNVESVDQLDDMNAAGTWGMTSGANIGILVVPGAYRICACEETDAGEFTLVARRISKEAMANMPTPLIFGYN